MSPWSDQEIQSFLEGWEFFESGVHARMKNGKHKLSRQLWRGLRRGGLRWAGDSVYRCWEVCRASVGRLVRPARGQGADPLRPVLSERPLHGIPGSKWEERISLAFLSTSWVAWPLCVPSGDLLCSPPNALGGWWTGALDVPLSQHTHPQQQWVASVNSEPHPELNDNLSSDPNSIWETTDYDSSMVSGLLPFPTASIMRTKCDTKWGLPRLFVPCCWGCGGTWKWRERPRAGRKFSFLADLGPVVLSLLYAWRFPPWGNP